MNKTMKLSTLYNQVRNLRYQCGVARTSIAHAHCSCEVCHLLHREYHVTKILKDPKNDESIPSVKTIDPIEISKEWIPPNRPLSGDKGKSDEYAMISPKSNQTASTTAQFPSKAQSNKLDSEDIVASMDGQQEGTEMINLEDIDLKQLQQTLNISDKNGLNTGFQLLSKANDINVDDYNDESLWEDIFDEEEGVDITDDESDFDYETAFENDKIIRDILNDEEFNTGDSELIDLQMSMIEERLEELKKKFMQSSMIKQEQWEQERESIQRPLPISKELNDVNVGSKFSGDFINEEYSEFDEFLKEKNNTTSANHLEDGIDSSGAPDWLKTRRAKLFPSDIMTPEESQKAQHLDGDIPIIKGKLLTSDEIISCLTSLGAIDTKLIVPDEKTLPFLGWDGLIIATGSSYSHIRVLTDAIVRNLRKRDLAQKGIIGALLGSEGGEDTSSARRRQGLPKRMDDSWIAVDCGNYIIHVQDDITRESIDLEGLWSPDERGNAGRELRKINPNDEEAVDEYVAKNPVPDGYAQTLVDLSGDFWGDGQMRGGYGLMGNSEKKGRWTSTSDKRRKLKNRRK